MTTAERDEIAESARLRRKLGLLLPELTAAGSRLIEHPRIRELYPEYLVRMHWIVRASVPLMEAARSRAVAIGPSDPTAVAVAAYFERHIDEELEHDEWVLEDLEALGRERSVVLERVPSPSVAQVVGAQYYWLFHYHPVALLGYTTLLEGYPPTPADVEALIAGTGYPSEAFRAIRGHAELDPGHAEELFQTIDALSLTPGQSAVLGLSAMSTAHGLTRVLDELIDAFALPA